MGLLTSDGSLWQRQRKLMSPAFSGQRLMSYPPAMVSATDRTLEDWADGTVRNVHVDMMATAVRIASKTLFNSDMEAEVEAMGKAVDRITDEIGSRFTRPMLIPDWVPLPGHVSYKQGIAHVEDIVARIVRDRRAGDPDRGDLLSTLIMARDESGQPMSERQIRDEAVTLLLAGHETTALGLTWTLLLLARHPDIQERVAAEIAAQAGDRELTNEDLAQMPLLEAILYESMRVYPPVWVIGREAIEDVTIGDHRVPKGTQIMISPWVIHRSPRNFEEPTVFNPDRWLGDLRKRLPRFAYLPFGGGPRVCIGNRFAMMELGFVVGTIMQRFRLTPRDDRPVVPIPTISLRPKGGVWLKVERRRAN
jgi:cytochrome P450